MAKVKGAELEQAMPKQSDKDMEWETENHLRTLHDASTIMSDPEKMQRVHKLAGRRHKALQGMLNMAGAPKAKINSLRSLKEKALGKGNVGKASIDADGNDSEDSGDLD